MSWIWKDQAGIGLILAGTTPDVPDVPPVVVVDPDVVGVGVLVDDPPFVFTPVTPEGVLVELVLVAICFHSYSLLLW